MKTERSTLIRVHALEVQKKGISENFITILNKVFSLLLDIFSESKRHWSGELMMMEGLKTLFPVIPIVPVVPVVSVVLFVPDVPVAPVVSVVLFVPDVPVAPVVPVVPVVPFVAIVPVVSVVPVVPRFPGCLGCPSCSS